MRNDYLSKNLAGFFNKKENLLEFRKLQMYFGENSLKHDADLENKHGTLGAWQLDNDKKKYFRKNDEESWWWEQERTQINLHPSEQTLRICLIGESAAHGMFFSPSITPAKSLQKVLDREIKFEVEVIDLTRICMNKDQMLATIEGCQSLQPDFVVIFAGNNWFADSLYDLHSPLAARRKYFSAFEKSNFTKLNETFAELLTSQSKATIDQIDDIAKSSSSQFLFVVPPVNLLNWERRTPPLLGDYDTDKWLVDYHQVVSRFESGDIEGALSLGLEMLEHDGGSNATTHRLVANAYIALGRENEAVGHLEKEASLAIVNSNFTSFPVTPYYIERLLLERPKYFKCINLNAQLKAASKIGIPGFDYFVDYCHLNEYGFLEFAKSVALHILDAQKLKNPPNIDLILKGTDSKFLAQSYFYIAIYFAHFNQPVLYNQKVREIKILLSKAVAEHEPILDMMENYIRAKSHNEGFNFSKDAQRLLKSSNSSLDMQISQSCMGVDSVAVESLFEVLEENGRDVMGLYQHYFEEYDNCLRHDSLDLTHPYFLKRVNGLIREAEDHEINSRRSIPFYKSFWPRADFELPMLELRKLWLLIVCRSQDHPNTKHTVKVNNDYVGEFVISDVWSKYEFEICESSLKPGFNNLSVTTEVTQQYSIRETIDRTEACLLSTKTEFNPILTEYFSIDVSVIQ